MAPRYNRREARRKANIFKTCRFHLLIFQLYLIATLDNMADFLCTGDLEAEDRMRSEATEEAEEAERAAAALVERERAAFQHAVERLVKPVATVKVLAAKVAATPDNKRKCASVKVVAKKLHKVAVVMPQVEQENADSQRAEEKVAATPIDKENNADAALKDPMMVAATPDNKRKCASVKVVAKKLHKVAVVMPQVEQEKADTQRAEEKVAATPIDKENNADAALKDPMMVAATRVDNNEINAAATLMDNLQPTTECLRHIFEQYLDDSESE